MSQTSNHGPQLTRWTVKNFSGLEVTKANISYLTLVLILTEIKTSALLPILTCSIPGVGFYRKVLSVKMNFYS